MANEKKRITALPTAPQVEDNDYLAIDNTSTPTAENEGGTRKILAKDVMAKSADDVDYDNTTSGLEADNVQDAIDEVLEEGGKVQDVKVNGVSVLDNNKTAQIVSYKEVTQAQYDALPSSKLTDGIMYCIKDSTFSASDVPYDNSDSGLESEDVQSAIDEIADVLGALKVEGTVENAQIATFTDGSPLPMPKLEIAVEPQQSGSGDPSPENIRPISGWSAVDVTVADDVDNPTTTKTITIQLGDTYYGGKLDVVSGVLTVDRAVVDMGDLYWSYTSDAKIFTATIQGIKSGVYTDTNLISSIYPVKPMSYSQFDYGMRYNSATAIGVKNPLYTDATAFKTAMNGVQLVYELATPQSIQLSPTQVNSLLGVNNIFANTGKILKVEYIRDLNIVINNLLNG